MIRWDKIDWTLQDVAIARQSKCSRERVRQMRKKLGKPKSANHGHRSAKVMTPERIALIGVYSDGYLARRFRCGNTTVFAWRKRLGIPKVRPEQYRTWTTEMISMLSR